jgi:BirA family biotin operon repressor/biotin-[acetyl-CoA-carboxylase] ligase
MNFILKEFDELGSTNTKAKELAVEGVNPWTVVVAKKQAAGYGRKGNAWFSPEGGLYFSVILPKSNVEDLQILTILSAFCVANSIKERFGVEPMIKLPNDVHLNDKKICGILTENIICGQIKSSVIGIGINTNINALAPGLEKTASSLKIELGRTIDNKALLGQIIIQLQSIFRSISQ